MSGGWSRWGCSWELSLLRLEQIIMTENGPSTQHGVGWNGMWGEALGGGRGTELDSTLDTVWQRPGKLPCSAPHPVPHQRLPPFCREYTSIAAPSGDRKQAGQQHRL